MAIRGKFFFWGVSQRDGARVSAPPAGGDSDPKKRIFPG